MIMFSAPTNYFKRYYRSKQFSVDYQYQYTMYSIRDDQWHFYVLRNGSTYMDFPTIIAALIAMSEVTK